MDIRIGKVTHYYTHLGVAVIQLEDKLQVGDMIAVLGHTTELVQSVNSMEINHQKVVIGFPGTEVAVKVLEPVRCGDTVYRATEPQVEITIPEAADFR